MKKLLTVVALFVAMNSIANANITVNEKVLTAFKQTFASASNPVWHEYADYYIVKFNQNDIDTRIKYDLEGNILETTRYYKEDALPIILRAKLKNRFADKTVFGVTEVSNHSEITYYIVLEDQKNWLNIKTDVYGNMQLEKKFKKA
jgi:hypothetical protein